MKMKFTALSAAILSATFGLAGCSGSGSDSSPSSVNGRVTGFGSVYVDGVEFETNDANITIDGVPASETDLRVGMLVSLSGSDNGTNGNATHIEFTDNLEGVVTQTVAAGGLIVMGHTITADSTTNIEGVTDTNNDGTIDIADLALDDKVEISGYADANGAIFATYIENEGSYNDGDEIEVKGTVANLDTTAMTFTIGSMTVDYTNATEVDAGLADGVYVEVKSNSAPDSITGVLAASKVELENDGEYGVHGDEGEELEIEGMITAIDTTSTPHTVTVNGQSFDVPTDFDISGFMVGDIIDIDIRVTDGIMHVTEMEADHNDHDDDNKIEIFGTVTSTDTSANTLSIAGITISVNPNTTIMLDHSETPEHFFNLGSLIEGSDKIKIDAVPNDNNGYTAIRIERVTSTDTHTEIEGPVTIDSTTSVMTIAGVSLDTSAVTIPTSVVDGTEIEVVGNLNSDNVFVVTVLSLD